MAGHISDASTLTVQWVRSTASGNQSNCVEVAPGFGLVYVRDSKNPTGPALTVAPAEFAAFIDIVRAGKSPC
ncbi:DUF397 domain-containing protein [Streptomyces blastmyceticus]|uniref:DUF397 domain-containing protein n=1 Tax=Streptomyces blastmyceticus TaxID=68180 RepID=A0ABN0WJK1_9ACTN